MAKTKRNDPDNRTRRLEQMEQSWEAQVERVKQQARPPAQPKAPAPAPRSEPPPLHIEAIKAEAEQLVAEKAAPGEQNYSRQNPFPGQSSEGKGLLWWTGGNIDDYIPLAEYGTRQRQTDLRTFALVAPMVMIAESVLIKKMQALQWSVESGRNKAIQWQSLLANLGQNQGWDVFIARWTRAYCESDYGGPAEIIRRVPRWAVDRDGQLTPRGEIALREGGDRAWPIADSRVMDPTQCTPTADPEFPLIFYNSFTGQKHRLRPYQFMRILDMPTVDDALPNQGTCAVSRAVWAAQEDRMVTRYGFEAISENPGTGMVLANVNQNLLETALESAKGARDARGVVYYKGMIFLPILDPSGNVKLEYLTFSHLPENFNRTEDYSRIKEIVASAFGMDVLELGSIPGHNLGTSAQAEVGAAKARGKGIGALITAVERQFRQKFLPQDVQLRIKKHDIDEQKDRAELDNLYFSMATSMVQVGAWDPVLANQYLADMGAIQSEFPYMAQDLTPSEELDDTEATEKRVARVRVDQDGVVHYKAHPFVSYAQKTKRAPPPAYPDGTRFAVQEGLEARDVLGAQRLFDRHLPEYEGLTDGVAPEPMSLARRARQAVGAMFQGEPEAPSQPSVVNVSVEPANLPDVVVKMDAPPVYVRADVHMPNETTETETIVDRDVSTGRITRTNRQTRRT